MDLIEVKYSDADVNDIKEYVFPRFIYSSSPDRGLDTLVQMFPDILRVFPEASLHVFYGLNNWDASLKANDNAWRQNVDWRNSIVKDLNELQEQGVVVHYGSRSQDELAIAMKSVDMWFYPTNFTETYCITALEAQLAETAIVTTKLAGLIDTVADRGILIEGKGDTPAYTPEYRDRALAEVCSLLRDHKKREAMTARAKIWAERQTWANRAREWLNIFGIAPVNVPALQEEDAAKLREIYDPAYYPSK